MRILGARRLSRSTDASTSIERQGEQITLATAARGDDLVAITEDVDVSGAVSPFERDDLGPWLTEPDKLSQYDAIMVTKLDRLTRSLIDFSNLIQWAQEHGKVIISLAESLDLSTPAGRMVAQILALFAQFERERIGERRKDRLASDRQKAWYTGMTVPPGYRKVKVDNHFELELDPEYSAEIRTMADEVIKGKSCRQVGKAHGDRTSGAVLSILRNPALRGYVIHEGQPVRGEDGMPVRRVAVLDDPTWAKLQAKLDKGAMPKSREASNGSMLTGILFCADCKNPLYYQYRSAGPRYRHADGSDCKTTFLAKEVEEAISAGLVSEIGWMPVTEKILVAGENHDAEIRRVEESISELDEAFAAGDVIASTYGRMQSKLEEKLDSLKSLPSTPDRIESLETGQTYSQVWEGKDREGRSLFLREASVKMFVRPGSEAVVMVPSQPGPMTTQDIPRVSLGSSQRYQWGISWGSLASLEAAAEATV